MSGTQVNHELSGDDLDFGGLDAAVLGAGLPAQAEFLIAQAGMIRHQVAEAQALLEGAHQLAPQHPATLIALYRFHFYGNRLAEARAIALRALDMASAALGVAREWSTVQPDPRFTALEALPRFYLFSLKGLAYLSLRLGEIEAGRAMVAKLAELDPRNKVGHEVLAGVIARIGREDADYEDEDERSEVIA
ncbi:tetratricopeptide repeat protein [Uliginosibacterium aquaticum]|uniref:Tetratricopeptide repeat protein n=1 Tax=Uliginosibacterium aquaticum TaxID=2731212 RepID=A0ABX2IE10_9RHOO|nr:hypothetical protein [Uliginosibacterium aquaticum]NSL54860.1 hypothetical protein [Uliginosibacterium aquaticum]